ncbi:MAG: winged helix-turn-helix domain-containing protein [Bacteroidia bacterium]|nr:winged helix-turn-helix transcriptional regulator [Bacteroidia bacterium]MCZ2277430.1 winged helix-turn-helix domain-containing protein [Bacteroidia bacterium]
MLSEKDIYSKKIKLIERIGVYFEKAEKLPPVAGRILASIMLTCKHGITFEQLVQEMQASKSTVFTHLSYFESTGRIDYYTKSGDRKRYYIPPADGLLNFINEKIKELQSQCTLHQDVISYKEAVNQKWKNDPARQCNLKFNKDIISMLEDHINLLSKLKTELIKDKKL